MKFIKRTLRRAARENTTEHAISQVISTLLVASAASPFGVSGVAIALLAVAVVRGLHNV